MLKSLPVRNSRTVLVSIVVLVFGLAATSLTAPETWLGWGYTTLSKSMAGSLYTSMLLAITGALLASIYRRRGAEAWLAASPRGRLGGLGEPLAILWIVGALAHLAVLALMLAMSKDASGQAWVSPPAALTLGVVLVLVVLPGLAASFGLALGGLLRLQVAVPLAAALPYIVTVGTIWYLVGTPLFGILAFDGRPWLYGAPTVAQLALKSALFGTLTVVLASIWLRKRKVFEFSGWVFVFALSATVFIGSDLRPISGSQDKVCADTVPRVCTDKAHSATLDQFSALSVNAVKVLPQGMQPTVIEASGNRPGVSSTEELFAAPVSGFTSPSFVVDRRLTLAAMGSSIFSRCAAQNVDQAKNQAVMEVWWRLTQNLSVTEPLIPGGAPWLDIPELASAVPDGQALFALPPVAREAWLRDHVVSDADCERGLR